jgi:hypothetical protein
MYALGFFEGVIERLGALVRDLFSMGGSVVFASNGTFTAILLLGLLAGLVYAYWWRAL